MKEAPVPFDLNLNDPAETVPVPVAGASSPPSDRPQKANLWVGLDNSEPGDLLELALNGQKLADVDVQNELPSVGYQISIPSGNGVLSYPTREKIDMRFQGIRLEVPVTALTRGRNRLSLRLKKRGNGEDRPLRVSRVELRTRF